MREQERWRREVAGELRERWGSEEVVAQVVVVPVVGWWCVGVFDGGGADGRGEELRGGKEYSR